MTPPEARVAGTPAPPVRPASDASVLARRGALTLVGGVTSGLLGFVAVLVLTHGVGQARTGQFFEGVSLFNIGSNVLLFGADVALMRFVSSDRAEQRGETRSLFRAALLPVLGASVLAAAVGVQLAPRLAASLSHGEPAGLLATYLRTLLLALPVAVAYLACVSTTRAFGTVKPFVVIDKVVKPLLQVLLLLLAVLIGAGAIALAGAWILPIALGLATSAWWLAARTRHERAASRTPAGRVWEFWRFGMPRGLAGIFQVLILWLDTLLIGLFRPAGEVAIYVASTRYVLLVLFVGNAITQAVAPQFGDLIARREMRRAEAVFRTATVWDIVVTWPLLVTLAVFAPVVLGVFGSGYASGAIATRILAVSMLIATAVGPVDWVLLMGGKSSWNLLNTGTALMLNVVLNVLLIPRFGIAAAAFAWGVSLVVNNVAPLIEVMVFLRISPFSATHRFVAVASILCFAIPGIVVAAILGQTVAALVVSVIVALAVYAAVLSRNTNGIQLPELVGALRRQTKGLETMRDTP